SYVRTLHIYRNSSLFFFLNTPPPMISTLFPYTTLFRSQGLHLRVHGHRHHPDGSDHRGSLHPDHREEDLCRGRPASRARKGRAEDRKSTRLNSSHVAISYAVFCLKKKKKKNKITNN